MLVFFNSQNQDTSTNLDTFLCTRSVLIREVFLYYVPRHLGGPVSSLTLGQREGRQGCHVTGHVTPPHPRHSPSREEILVS